MDEMFTDTAHNFGIYTKSGKRTIFQIDFAVKRISLIERGKISKSFDFDNLDQYDSEENLHILIRFRNNKTLEFDADTAEEKYTICRLLGIILGADAEGPEGVETRGQNGIQRTLGTKRQVIKEAVLEKKGNTLVPTWSRRRIQVCPGEFSYYKPGDEVALNLVQLWENSTTLASSGTNGFTISVRDRAYHFKVPSEKGINQEQERNKWLEAFKQASQRKRTTFLLLEMSKQKTYDTGNTRQGVPLPSIPSDEDVSYYNDSARSKGSSSGSEGRELMEEFEAINELDEVLEDDQNQGKRKDIALSVVQKSGPMLSTPNKNRARPPAMHIGKGSSGSSFRSSTGEEDQPTYDFIPEPDYSPPASPSGDRNQSKFSEEPPPPQPHIQKDRPSGKYAKVISLDDNEAVRENSGKYTHVIQRNDPQRHSGDYAKSIKPSPGAIDVMPKISEIPKLKPVRTQNSQDNNDRLSPREKGTNDNDAEKVQLSVKQIQANLENTYANETEKSDKVPSPREKSKFPPPAPSGPRRAPPPPTSPIAPTPPAPLGSKPPAPCPPYGNVPAPPPPLMNGGRPTVKGKLKQIHWSRTPKPLVNNSIWERPHDMTPVLNIRLLEEQFSLKDRDTLPTPVQLEEIQYGRKSSGSKQQLLIEPKRAQNLGIFMAGLKNEGARRLLDVLNSVVEDDNFPVEKLTIIRRLQPTEDEIDMYMAYTNKRHELLPVDQFMYELCQIPCLNIRIDICLTIWEFPWQYESTCQLVDQVHAACDELLNSQMLVVVLEYILAIGNHLNRNWSESNVTSGFLVTSLDKILDVRGKDAGYTLVHFLVEQLRKSDPGLIQWTETVQIVKKCEQVSVKSVAAESEVLKGDLTKIKRYLKTLKSKNVNSTRQDNKFQQDAQNLTVEYEMKLEKLDRRCSELQLKYRQILTRFGEPLYQKSDQMFAMIANFADKFKTAVKDLDSKNAERKKSTS